MSAIGQGGEGQAQSEGQASEAQGPDLNGMVEQLSGVASGMEEMRQFIASQPWQQAQQEGEAEQDGGELDLSWLDQPQFEADPAALQQRLSDQINQAIERGVEARVAPLQNDLKELRYEQRADYLTRDFPELADQKAAEAVVSKAHQLAQHLGQPELGNNPDFWHIVHMAERAAELANAENGSGDPEAARLESGSGPGPASTKTEADLVNDIVNAGDGLGRRVLDFRQ